MKEDTKQILENMEKELMREALLEEQEAGPAFEDPDVLETGPEPKVYSNFANDYGGELARFAESGGQLQEEKEESVITILMLIASILSLSIICVMLYWLHAWM
ncbi:MAG: hypothetical protein IJB91_00940 [Oscillospiraceae bacterium]|nr:hypothetical protein [Oscillospiraceae bacterium]